MNDGILIAVGEDGGFQVVAQVASLSEAQEMIADYITHGPFCDCLAPDHFEVHSQGPTGYYTRIETIAV